MKSIYRILFSLILVLSVINSFAQGQPVITGSPKNIIKINATNLFFKNFDFQYERLLNGHWSVLYGVRIQPFGTFPGQGTLKRDVNTGNDVSDFDRENFSSSNLSLTPELRYYFGSQSGKGFYVGAFFKYNYYTAKDFNLTYVESPTSSVVVPIGGNFNTYSGGLVVGRQFELGSRFTLDLFLGGHLGKAKGELNADYATLTSSQQTAVQGLLDGVVLKHMSEKAVNAEVGKTHTTIKIDGPWEAFRGGVSLGWKF